MAKKCPKGNKAKRSKVGKVMSEFKEGKLKHSAGGKVKSRKMAIAISLSEAGLSKKKAKKKNKKSQGK